jgi:hypothetical protein
MGVRKAKIGKNAVAHEFGDETVIARHHARAGVLIGADHLAHILRVEPRRQGGRAREVAEHNGQLTAFGGVLRRGAFKACKAWGTRCSLGIAEICNRLEDSLAGSERQAKLFEVGLGQIRQNIGLDFTVAKRAFILAEPEAAQPRPDVHSRSPCPSVQADDGPGEIACPVQ